MFYISCKHGDLYGVTDTKDGVVEMYTVDQILGYVRSGINIRGIRVASNGNFVIECKSDNVLNDFISCIKPSLARFKLLGVHERNELVSKLQDIAMSYGVIEQKSQLSVDIENSKLFIKSPAFSTFIDFQTGNSIQKLDVCDKRVMELSRLGIKALENITLNVSDDLTITMKDVVDEIIKVEQFGYYTVPVVRYIGITPSNKMFKVILSNDLIYSVKVDTYEKVKRDAEKIMGTKTEKMYGFEDYLWKGIYSNSSKFLISKFTRKSITGSSYNNIIRKLKSKYTTLHDVYTDRTINAR